MQRLCWRRKSHGSRDLPGRFCFDARSRWRRWWYRRRGRGGRARSPSQTSGGDAGQAPEHTLESPERGGGSRNSWGRLWDRRVHPGQSGPQAHPKVGAPASRDSGVVPEVTSCQLIASVLLLLLWFGPGSAECCAAALFALRLARVSSLSLIRLRSLTSCPTPGTGSTISWNRCGLSVNIDNYTLFTCFVIVLSWCCFCWILSFSVWKGIQENRMVGVAWVLELSALMMTLCQRLATDFFSSFFT